MRELLYKYGRGDFRTFDEGIEREWLMTNGIGGFANQSIIGANQRIFSGYLIASLNPPIDRYTVFSSTHECLRINGREFDFTSQEYPGYIKEGQRYMVSFEYNGVPTYTYKVHDVTVKKTVSLVYGRNKAVVCYDIKGGNAKSELTITPLFTIRPFDKPALANEVKLGYEIHDDHSISLTSDIYKDITTNVYVSSGRIVERNTYKTSMAEPDFTIDANEYYRIDGRNGFLGVDNQFTPIDIVRTVEAHENVKLYISCKVADGISWDEELDGFTERDEYINRINHLMASVDNSDTFVRKLSAAADNFIVDRKSTGLKTILAGFPWFADWGRDTMIALTGLTLCTGRYNDCAQILESFSKYEKNGLIPNVFPNTQSEEPMYNTIDGSMWYFYAVYKYLKYTDTFESFEFVKDKIYSVLKNIIRAYENGTEYGIHMDDDYMIMGGSDLDQLTWMDVRVGEIVVTPRHGKAVEINALWYNALKIMEWLSERFEDIEGHEHYEHLAMRVKENYTKVFWNEKKSCLNDVIDEYGVADDSIRPNQIFAVSLPFELLDGEKAHKVVDKVYEELYTPYGLRSLGRNEKGYKKEYIGKLFDRDMAYHMGTVWAYLFGPFITAYTKVNDHADWAVMEAYDMCQIFGLHLNDGCINGVSEIFDGDFPSTGRGCYSQAWSVGELIRCYYEDVLPYM